MGLTGFHNEAPWLFYLEGTLSLMSPRYELYFLMDRTSCLSQSAMIYDMRRKEEAHTEERIGNPTASRRGTAAKFIVKRGFAEEMWGVVCFYRRKERRCFSFVSDPVLGGKVLSCAALSNSLVFFSFCMCVCVTKSSFQYYAPWF